jgi:Acetyltransferase (GNAT) domain
MAGHGVVRNDAAPVRRRTNREARAPRNFQFVFAENPATRLHAIDGTGAPEPKAQCRVSVRDLMQQASVAVLSRAELAQCGHWPRAFADQRKDRRYYELVEDTIRQEFDYRYFVIKDGDGEVQAVQPFFVLDQDLAAGMGARSRALVAAVRRVLPRFLRMRTLMVGCAAGEGHIDGSDELARRSHARALAKAALEHARALKTPMIVFKEFPARYRDALACFREHDYTRIPSLPMTRLRIDYASFDEYLSRALSRAARKDVRRKLKAAAQAPAIEMEMTTDISPFIDEVYPLYLAVYERSSLQFEKLTREYLCELGRRMPDKVRFFVWRQQGRIVAFSVCLVQDDTIYDEYLGLDYRVALDLHLYHYTFRDIVSWAIANGCQWYVSSSLNYDPKLHLRCLLDPLDLYVRHASPAANAVLKRVLPWLEPTRNDPTLKKFANYAELWGRP